ncbi:hypothetical protein [Pseudanabaena sp. FACHB-2040]|uniref:hypothetical protein n=1 Tax=Pseudanabaena sp. FACHB-2040 TaxID=2692859 RepID=UPI0016851E30|nr:hypothetical protein [Pseudanabaena sp. FACHB-2040]MBD2256656.1 hypothetical protein [Pseudanabaena sp. FACHB-2040]
MSNIQTVRQRLQSWITGLVRIDAFDADPPKALLSPSSTEQSLRPANTCIAYPVKDLVYERTDLQGICGRGRFAYSIAYRYPGELTLDEIPIQKLEGVVQYLQGMSLLGLAGSGGIKHVEPDAEEFPIQLERDGTDQDDWLVYCNLALLIEFNLTDFDLDPDFGPAPEQPVGIDQLTIAVNRAEVGFDADVPADYTLDTEIVITRPQP